MKAVSPWRAHLVLVGGWAYRLYRLHPLAISPEYNAIFTRDTDLAFASEAPLEGDIKEALSDSHFKEELSGEHHPPVSRYTLKGDDQGFYAEFLTPLTGSGRLRNGNDDATLLKAGITAQKLRYLDILFASPWIFRLGPEQGVEQLTDFQVANPVSFIVQKILIHDRRPLKKQAQDLLYIHDTFELFADNLPELQKVWLENVQPNLSIGLRGDLLGRISGIFDRLPDALREAARIPADRSLRPERMQSICAAGLAELFQSDRS